MRIIPVEHRDIITSSTDADIEDADVRTFNWTVLLPLFLSLMFGFSSCKDTDLPVSPERDLVPISFSVEMDNEVGTRLCIDDGYDAKMNWEVGDRIKLYDGCTTPHVLEYKSTGKFEGDVCPNRSYSDYRAVYPVSTTSSYNDVSIGATQAAVIGSFDKASAPMIAFAPEANKLSFKRAFSLLKIAVPAGYSKIVVSNYSSSGNASYLTGAATLTYSSEVSIDKNSGTTSVTLVPSSGTEIAEGTYYLSVFPCELTGLQMACYKGNEIFFKCKAGNSSIARKEVVNVGNLKDSSWRFTCEAFKITPSGSSGYYLADRNLGAANTSDYGNFYTKSEFSSSTPSSVWGPGWSMPNEYDLGDWADMIELVPSGNIAVTNGPYPEIYFPLCAYWGYNDTAPYLNLSLITEVNGGTVSLSAKVSDSPIDGASIRPVFKVPVQQ